jgi:uncharacterized phage infection (PIP) family protein YhgE
MALPQLPPAAAALLALEGNVQQLLQGQGQLQQNVQQLQQGQGQLLQNVQQLQQNMQQLQQNMQQLQQGQGQLQQDVQQLQQGQGQLQQDVQQLQQGQGQLQQDVQVLQQGMQQALVLLQGLQPAALLQCVHAITLARRQNAHDQNHVYKVVLLDVGVPPQHWPAGLNRDMLRGLSALQVDTLLGEYGLPHGAVAGVLAVRRNTLALHIGTTLL